MCHSSSRSGSTWKRLNNIPHVVSSPEACADTNKSFTMFYPLLRAAHQTALSIERKGACVHWSDCVSGRWMACVLSNYLMLLLFLNKLFRCTFSGYALLLSICFSCHHLDKCACVLEDHAHTCVQEKTTHGCRFLSMFTSRVYIIGPSAPCTRKAKGPAILFVCCLEADGKTGLRIKGKFKLQSPQYKPGIMFQERKHQQPL